MRRSLLLLLGVALLSTSCVTQRSTSLECSHPVDYLQPEQQRQFDYLYLEGSRQSMLGHHDAAFDLYREAAAIDTLNAAVKYSLSNYYMQLNRPQQALDLLQSAVDIDADNYWYSIELGNLLYRMNRPDDAIAIYQRLVKDHPKKVELSYMLAEAYNTKGDMPNAIVALDNVEQSMGLNEAVSMQKYRMYNAIDEPDKAFAEIEALVSAFPSQVHYYIMLGDLYLEANRLDDALATYERAQKVDPEDGYVLVAKASYYERAGNQEAAQELVHSALLNPKVDVETKMELFLAYLKTSLQQNRDKETLYSLFDQMLEMHPDAESLIKLYADFLLSQQKYDEAELQLHHLVEIAPTNRDYWGQLITIALFQADYDSVVNYGKRAVSQLPNEVPFYLYMGSAYTQQEQYQAAIEVLEQGVEVAPVDNFTTLSEVYGQLGDTYHQWGKVDTAYTMYDKSLEYNPNNIMVLNNYSYFLTLEKRDLDKAEQMSGKVVKLEPKNATYLDTYAWVFFVKGDYMLAKMYLDIALSNGGGSNPELVEHYGDVLYHTDGVEKAIEQWKKAVEMGADSELLKKKISEEKYIEP